MSQDAKAEFEAKQSTNMPQTTNTNTKAVDLQAQLDSTKIIAANIRQDIEKFRGSSGEIKASQKKIRDITKRLEAGNLSASNIKQIQKEIIETKTAFQKTVSPRVMGGPTTPRKKDVVLVNVANTLYTEAGFTAKTRLDQKPVKPTAKQLKARLGLAVLEPILGGTQEALFPFAQSVAESRPATSVLRIAGAVATPTAADFAFGWVLSKTGATKAGRRLLKKMEKYLLNIDDPIMPKLTKWELEEVRQWEKMGLTHLRRYAKANPGIFDKVEDIAEYYRKHPAQFSAGASVIPEEVYIFQNVAYDFDLDSYELINFIKKNDDLFADGSLLVAIIPTLSKKDAAKVLEETTSLPKDKIDDLVEQLRKVAPRQTPTLDTPPVEEPPIEEPILDIPPDTPPVEEPPIQVPRLDIPTDTPPILEPILDEPPTDTPEPTPPLLLSLKDREKRRKLTLQLHRGRALLYKVDYTYKGGRTETIGPFEARSLPSAVQRAQKTRRTNKTLPIVIDVKLIGEKKK